jgi:hypothetical protein
MALLIQKDVSIYGNIGVSELYVRFQLDYNVVGNNVMTHSQVYDSRVSYDADHNSNKISVEGIPNVLSIQYDRAIDGSDLLTAVHNKFKSHLSTDIYEDVPLLDPSTGEYQYDPSTGGLITESVLTGPKFADASNISLIDID